MEKIGALFGTKGRIARYFKGLQTLQKIVQLFTRLGRIAGLTSLE